MYWGIFPKAEGRYVYQINKCIPNTNQKVSECTVALLTGLIDKRLAAIRLRQFNCVYRLVCTREFLHAKLYFIQLPLSLAALSTVISFDCDNCC